MIERFSLVSISIVFFIFCATSSLHIHLSLSLSHSLFRTLFCSYYMHIQIYLHIVRIPTEYLTKNFISTQIHNKRANSINANKKLCTFQMSLNGTEVQKISAKMWKVKRVFSVRAFAPYTVGSKRVE